MAEKLKPRDNYLQNIEREYHDATAIKQGAEYRLTGNQLLLLFTPEQVAHAKQEMLLALEPGRIKNKNIMPGAPKKELPATMRIPLKNGDVEIPNQSLCTFEVLLKNAAIIEKEYPKLIADLPNDEPWKYPKAAHALLTTDAGKKTLYEIQQQSPEENYYLLLFIIGNHDLGRVIDAKKRHGLPLPAECENTTHHGTASVQLLKNWGVLSSFSQDTQEIISYSLEHHADMVTPKLEPNASDTEKIKHAFTCLVRDIDKLSLFVHNTDKYLSDEKTKAGQIQMNNLEGEQGMIKPVALLDDFTKYKIIDRTRCQSYEAFMLQFLAWIYDVNVKKVLKQIVQSGAVEKLLEYFKNHLPENQYQDILQATNSYLESQELKN